MTAATCCDAIHGDQLLKLQIKMVARPRNQFYRARDRIPFTLTG